MKKILFTILSILSISVSSQITDLEEKVRKTSVDTLDGWKNGGVININFSQASFKNWSAGGQNSISLNNLVSVFANYKKGRSSWDNMLDVGYGFLTQGNVRKKTDDKIDFTSKFGRSASKSWYYAALLNFKTQMDDGFDYKTDTTKVKISSFMAPAYVVGAFGMDYRPSDNFTGFIAPLTSKTTIVANKTLSDSGAFGIDRGKTVKNEFGGYIKLVYKHNFFKDNSVSLLSKVDLFSNYLNNPQYIDVNWENIISLKVNKYISTIITTQLIYDHDIFKDKVQFKEVIGVGFSYKF